MPFLVIRGTFHVKGYSPDGDSIRFQAEDPGNWVKLDELSQEVNGFRVNLNARDHAQLRFEAIDALETHYQGEHQPPQFANAARSRLLSMLNIQNVVLDAESDLATEADDGTAGYILSRSVDRFHRPIAFVYAGVPDSTDGAEIMLRSQLLRRSLNYRLMAQGLAYPTFYTGLFADLRATMTRVAQKARDDDLGFWPQDRTNAGATVTQLSDVTDLQVTFPKLFRRLVAFIETDLIVGELLSGFKEHLRIAAERVMVLPDGHFTHFDNVVEVNGNVVSITEQPENLVFFE